MASPAERRRCNICDIVRLRKIACLWRKLAGGGRRSESKPPHDIPPGHLAVMVGESSRRFVIKATYLNHPVFRQLLDEAYEEYGHSNYGVLAIPCDEFLFEDIIQSLRDCRNVSLRSCHEEEKARRSSWGESRSLLQRHAKRPTW